MADAQEAVHEADQTDSATAADSAADGAANDGSVSDRAREKPAAERRRRRAPREAWSAFGLRDSAGEGTATEGSGRKGRTHKGEAGKENSSGSPNGNVGSSPPSGKKPAQLVGSSPVSGKKSDAAERRRSSGEGARSASKSSATKASPRRAVCEVTGEGAGGAATTTASAVDVSEAGAAVFGAHRQFITSCVEQLEVHTYMLSQAEAQPSEGAQLHDYVGTLECLLRERQAALAALQAQLETFRHKIGHGQRPPLSVA
jgi:hypothetical protein